MLSDVSEVKYKCWLLVTALPSSTLETRGDLLLSPADGLVSHPGAAGCWHSCLCTALKLLTAAYAAKYFIKLPG